MANLWAWYKADAGVTGTTSVTAWADQSGSGNDLAAVSGFEPALLTGELNGLPAVARGSIDARMNTAAVVPDLSTIGGTIFIVGKQAVSGDVNAPYLSFGTSQSVNIRRQGATADANRFGVNSASGATNNDRAGVTDGTYHTLRLRVDNVNQFASINNDAETSIACILGSFAGGTILELLYSSGTFGDKAICELIIFTRSLNSTELGQMEDYLRTKYSHY